MREIKFRAWDTGINKMTYDNFSVSPNGKLSFYWQPESFHSARSLLMQYTGKKDDNEKEIYDGDLVTDINGETHSVEWNDDTLKWQLSNGRPLNDEENYSSYLIVVGNIFENKELILER